MPGTEADKQLLGVRLATVLLSSATTLALCGVTGAVIGFGAGLAAPAPFAARASVQLGRMFPKEPVEPPTITIQRIVAAAQPIIVAAEDGDISAIPKIGRDQPRYGIIIDLTAKAKTASTALAILRAALTEVENTHSDFRDFDSDVNEQQRVYSERRALRLLEAAGTDTALEAQITDALLIARQDQASLEALETPFNAPRTRIIKRSATAERGVPRWLIFAFAGGVGGVFIGLLAVWVAFSISQARLQAELEPASALLVFVASHSKTILATAAIVGLLGAIATVLMPSKYTATMTIQSARVAPDSAFEHVSATILRVEDFAIDFTQRECGLTCKLDFTAIPVRGALNDRASTDIILLRARHTDAALARRLVEAVAGREEIAQRPAYDAKIAIWNNKVERLRDDIEVLEKVGEATVGQVALMKLIHEFGATQRFVNPSRSYPPRTLVPALIEPPARLQRALIAAAIGVVMGSLLGLGIAIFGAARR